MGLVVVALHTDIIAEINGHIFLPISDDFYYLRRPIDRAPTWGFFRRHGRWIPDSVWDLRRRVIRGGLDDFRGHRFGLRNRSGSGIGLCWDNLGRDLGTFGDRLRRSDGSSRRLDGKLGRVYGKLGWVHDKLGRLDDVKARRSDRKRCLNLWNGRDLG